MVLSLKLALMVLSIFAHLHVCRHYVLISLLTLMNYHTELAIIVGN